MNFLHRKRPLFPLLPACFVLSIGANILLVHNPADPSRQNVQNLPTSLNPNAQTKASHLGVSETATMASLIEKKRTVIEKAWGRSNITKPHFLGVYHAVRGFEFVRVTYGFDEAGNYGDDAPQSIAYVWLVPKNKKSQWQDVLKMAGFKTNGVRLDGDTLKGVQGLPPGFEARWTPYGDPYSKKALLLTAKHG